MYSDSNKINGNAWKYLQGRGIKIERGERKERKRGVWIIGVWIDDLLASRILRYAADIVAYTCNIRQERWSDE